MFNSYRENTLVYDLKLCNGCGRCVEVCPHAVFEMDGRLAKLVRGEGCMECGACEVNCVTGAITVASGVGCATAMLLAALKGQKEAECSCS
jgi:NAD-dependent dihydropyrimidine dehydrogenase PreA subunit